jgi:hypothetical protein
LQDSGLAGQDKGIGVGAGNYLGRQRLISWATDYDASDTQPFGKKIDQFRKLLRPPPVYPVTRPGVYGNYRLFAQSGFGKNQLGKSFIFSPEEKVEMVVVSNDSERSQGFQMVDNRMHDPVSGFVIDEYPAGGGGKSQEPGLQIAALVIDDQVVTGIPQLQPETKERRNGAVRPFPVENHDFLYMGVVFEHIPGSRRPDEQRHLHAGESSPESSQDGREL